MLDDVVKTVIIHLATDVLNHVLGSGDDVLVKVVRVWRIEHDIAHLRIEHEILLCSLFKSRDVLYTESVSVKPWKEDIANNALNAFPRESKGLRSNDWTVAQVKAASVSSVCVCNEKGIWVILLRL